jgi:hypothetical protein
MGGHAGGEGQGRAAVEEGANGGAGGDMVGYEHALAPFATGRPTPCTAP